MRTEHTCNQGGLATGAALLPFYSRLQLRLTCVVQAYALYLWPFSRQVLDGNIDAAQWFAKPDLSTALRFGADLAGRDTWEQWLKLCGEAGPGYCTFSAGSYAATRSKWAQLVAVLRERGWIGVPALGDVGPWFVGAISSVMTTFTADWPLADALLQVCVGSQARVLGLGMQARVLWPGWAVPPTRVCGAGLGWLDDQQGKRRCRCARGHVCGALLGHWTGVVTSRRKGTCRWARARTCAGSGWGKQRCQRCQLWP